jgi:hypothetical protein
VSTRPENRKLDEFWMTIQKKHVEALSAEQQVFLEWKFGSGNTGSLGNVPQPWEEHAEENDMAPEELPVILRVNAPYFRKSDKRAFEWALLLLPHLLPPTSSSTAPATGTSPTVT